MVAEPSRSVNAASRETAVREGAKARDCAAFLGAALPYRFAHDAGGSLSAISAPPNQGTTPHLQTAGTSEPLPWWRWALLGVQLLLALLVIQQFWIESRTFFQIATLMAAGWAVHATLPLRFRLPTFAGISVAGLWIALGTHDAAILLILGAVLIGICHLPVSLRVRVGLLLVAGGGLAVLRATALRWPAAGGGHPLLPSGMWAILGSMFMFRLAVYLHALQTRTPDDPSPTIARTLAYFFMVPNVAFPLYPVVDYNTFARDYYDRPALQIYETGARWIARGLVHLLLYRLVYDFVANDPAWLHNLSDLLRYLLSTYFLYFRISGSFHLIVGLLCLFGFRLPETHHLYFLAESFTDYWRRINIYWKDFMMKLVYYPSFFWFRKQRGEPLRALAWSTALVFVATWALHSYQWFWLRGQFPLTWPDVLFWGTLGTLVLRNSRREAQRGRKRVVSTDAPGWRGWRWSRAARVLGTFTVLCILWSLWSADSVFDWLLMWRAAGTVRPSDVGLLGGLLGATALIAGRSWDAPVGGRAGPRAWYRDPALATSLLLLVPLALARPQIQGWFGPDGAALLTFLRHPSFNARDAARMQRGYYERLDAPGRLAQELWEPVPERPADFVPFEETYAYRRRHDFLGAELTPSTTITVAGNLMTINRWGMRGAEVERAKAPGVFRVATVGPSYMLGWGSPDSGTIQARLSEHLDRELGEATPGRYQVLNFSVSAHSIGQQLAMLDDRVYDFGPDVVLVSIDRLINSELVRQLVQVIAGDAAPIPYPALKALLLAEGIELEQRGPPVPFATLRRMIRGAGGVARMPEKEVGARLRECSDTLVAWALDELARSIRAHGAVPVGVAIELVLPLSRGRSGELDHALRAARAAGMITIDTRDVYRGHDLASLRVSEWDMHPNQQANALIAERIADELEQQPEVLGHLGHPLGETHGRRH